MKRLQMIALLVAAGALLAVPAVGQAHQTGAQHNHGKANGKGKSCANNPTVRKGFVVKGTLTSYTAGAAESVTISVTGANKHARVSGELDDQNLTQPGTQIVGDSYTVDHVNPPDAFTVELTDYDSPTDILTSANDRVRIVGKVTVTRKKCAAGDPVAQRYGAVDIRRVKIVDGD